MVKEQVIPQYNRFGVVQEVAEIAHPTTTFTYSGLEPETTYCYRVSAVDEEGNEGDLSDPDSATTLAEPVDGSFDGTNNGAVEGQYKSDLTSESKNIADNALQSSADGQTPYWTGPWPTLHVPFTQTIEGQLLPICIAIDILQNMVLETFQMVMLVEDSVSEIGILQEIDGVATGLYNALGGPLSIWGTSLRIALILIETTSLIPVPAWIATLAGLVVAWGVMYTAWVYAVMAAVDGGIILPIQAAALFLLMAISMMPWMRSSLVGACKTASAFIDGFKLLQDPLWKDLCGLGAVLTILIIAFKLGAFLSSLILFIVYVIMHANLYGWE